MLPGQMSQWQLDFVLDVPWNLHLKFEQNRVSHSWEKFVVEDPQLIWWRSTAYMLWSRPVLGFSLGSSWTTYFFFMLVCILARASVLGWSSFGDQMATMLLAHCYSHNYFPFFSFSSWLFHIEWHLGSKNVLKKMKQVKNEKKNDSHCKISFSPAGSCSILLLRLRKSPKMCKLAFLHTYTHICAYLHTYILAYSLTCKPSLITCKLFWMNNGYFDLRTYFLDMPFLEGTSPL